jgi:hypothetical protein
MLQTINGIDFLLAFVILILIVWVRILNTTESNLRYEIKERITKVLEQDHFDVVIPGRFILYVALILFSYRFALLIA